MSAPLRELVNVFEVESEAKPKLGPALFAEVSGGERRAFDRITFRPRMMRNVTALDLSVELFGEKHFTPILVGPVAGLHRFHAGGEAAWRQGAAEAHATAVTVNTGDGWVQLDPGAPAPPAAKVLVLRGYDWPAIDALRRQTKAAIVLKGVLSVEEAKAAASRGVQGLILSNHGVSEGAAPLDVLPTMADAVGGRLTLLIDGGFRRGTDIAMALALGARAVLIARPAVWGLAAYGAEGVQVVVEMLQAELARAVAMLGRVNVAELDRSAVRVHRS